MDRWFKKRNPINTALIRPRVSKFRLYRWYWMMGSREPSLGLLFLASYLSDNGFNTAIFDGERQNTNDLLKDLANFRPTIIGLTATTFAFKEIRRLSTHLRKIFPDTLIILGGSHASALPEETMIRIPEIDACVAGEGEETLLEIVSGSRPEEIQGLIWRDGFGNMRKNARRPVIDDLDRYSLSWNLLNNFPEKYSPPWQNGRGKKSASLVVTRGCPFPCTFCASSVTHGKKRRAHSPAYVVNQMGIMSADYDINSIYFHDDHFTLDVEWLKEFCSLIKLRNLKIQWSCSTRTEPLDMDILKIMRECGCRQIGVGVESVSERTLKRIGKGYSPLFAFESLTRIKMAGIETKVYIMFGIPGETINDFKTTLRFVMKAPIDHIQILYFSPLPGSRSFEEFPIPESNWPKMNLLIPLAHPHLPVIFLRFWEVVLYAYIYLNKFFNRNRAILKKEF